MHKTRRVNYKPRTFKNGRNIYSLKLAHHIYTGPFGYPPNLHIASSTNSEIRFAWDQLQPINRNGVISGYFVAFAINGVAPLTTGFVPGESNTAVLLTKLDSGQTREVVFMVAAVNDIGIGVLTPALRTSFPVPQELGLIRDSSSQTNEFVTSQTQPHNPEPGPTSSPTSPLENLWPTAQQLLDDLASMPTPSKISEPFLTPFSLPSEEDWPNLKELLGEDTLEAIMNEAWRNLSERKQTPGMETESWSLHSNLASGDNFAEDKLSSKGSEDCHPGGLRKKRRCLEEARWTDEDVHVPSQNGTINYFTD